MDALSLTIRRMAGPGDADFCARLMATSEPWLTLSVQYEDALANVEDPLHEVHLACIGDERAGFIVLQLTGAFRGYVKSIGVSPQRRGCGVGSALLDFGERAIFEKCANVFICASSFNTGALRLYRRRGYHRVGELKDYLVRGYSEILMRKTVGPWAEFRPAGH